MTWFMNLLARIVGRAPRTREVVMEEAILETRYRISLERLRRATEDMRSEDRPTYSGLNMRLTESEVLARLAIRSDHDEDGR